MQNKLELTLDFDIDLERHLQRHYPEITDFHILSKSLDARKAPRGKKPQFHYILEVIRLGEHFSEYKEDFSEKFTLKSRPIIIGAGPAGLFAALRFAEYGIQTVIIERGDQANKRMLYISKYWKKGILNTESNVCFGEGGAGLFSDGKLITRVKSPFIKYVMNKFVEYGAPAETAYISNPHLGSNKIRKIITKISDDLTSKGHEIFYNQKMTKLLFSEDERSVIGVELADGKKLYSDHVILATGHSAGEVYHHLHHKKVAIKPKDFAVGVRIEHPRELIDKIQHGCFFESEVLGAARYRLSYHNQTTNRGTYSFCMCPGGYVLSSGTEPNGIVVNGMSNYARNSRWSNSALVVSVKRGLDFTETDILAGLDFQHVIEQKAYALSVAKADGKQLPAMTVKEFVNGKLSQKILPKTSSPSGVFKADLRDILPTFIIEHLQFALKEFEKKMPGFISDEALLIAPETRTSAPITILRDKITLESTSHRGLYPSGEGAGYAGGITSAAVDGIRVAEAILRQ